MTEAYAGLKWQEKQPSEWTLAEARDALDVCSRMLRMAKHSGEYAKAMTQEAERVLNDKKFRVIDGGAK